MSEMELRRCAEQRPRGTGRCSQQCLPFYQGAMFGSAAIRATAVLTSRGWALLSLWSLYFGYHVRRWLWPETAPAEPRLRFYRREVKQRLEYGRIGLRSGLPVAFLGLALVLGPARGIRGNAAPPAQRGAVPACCWLSGR